MSEVKPGSVAAPAGIEAGALILQGNLKPVRDAGEFQRAVKEGSGGRRLLLLVRPDDTQRFVGLSR